MSTNIVKASPSGGAIMPQSVDDLIRLGKILAASGYFADARSEAQAVTKVLAGLELGLSPMVSMTGIHVIEGKPAVGAGLMASLVRRSGRYDYAVIENTDVACEIEFFRDGQAIGHSRFTIDDAKQAKVQFTSSNGKPTSWTKFPRNMLFARAMSNGVRWYCPDVTTAPLYTPEELGATVDGATGEVIDASARAAPQKQVLRAATNGHAAPADEPHYSAEVEAIGSTDAGLVLCEVIMANTTGFHRSGALKKCLIRMAELVRDGYDIELLRGAVEAHLPHLLNGDKAEVYAAGVVAKSRIDDTEHESAEEAS
ncbi:MAG: hypothetical protein DYG90_00445 [Chloroflexi bacterium CFX6]|nr:hypothetical protein [Chloroflexi bacterium CFX6]